MLWRGGMGHSKNRKEKSAGNDNQGKLWYNENAEQVKNGKVGVT